MSNKLLLCHCWMRVQRNCIFLHLTSWLLYYPVFNALTRRCRKKYLKNGFRSNSHFLLYSLDCEKNLSRYMPRFRCVIDLVLHYTNKHSSKTVWVDRYGCPHSPVLLKSPMRKSPPTLLHAARLAIHKALDSNPLVPKLKSAPKHRLLPLPTSLLDYLDQYPYSI